MPDLAAGPDPAQPGPGAPPDRGPALDRVRAADSPPALDGVPMVLALVDATGTAAAPATTGDGPAVAERLRLLTEALAPDADDADQRTLHLLLATASAETDAVLAPGTPSTRAASPGAATTRPASGAPSVPVVGSGLPPGARAQTEALRAGSYLRVVNFHTTPASRRARLREELRRLAERGTSIGTDDLDAFFTTGRWPSGGEVFAPVFYEGYANSADVAAEVCDELGITGWFAVCTGFVDCPVEQQEVYARAHWIGLAPEELDGRRLAMTWDDVARLSTRHVVFPHTSSHAGVGDVTTDADLDREVVAPKRRMDAVTGQDSALHAWLLGTAHGAGARHDAAVEAAGYRYVVSNTMVQRIGASSRVT